MSLFDRLAQLYLFGDRIRGGEIIAETIRLPIEEAKRLVWEAAKAEGRSDEQMPWESGENYDRRINGSG